MVGGGTGGHFYPLIAVAQQIHREATERHLIKPRLIYIGPEPFDNVALDEQNMEYRQAPAGKIHRHSTLRNALSFAPITFGVIKAFFQLFSIFPNVVFSTGGYAAFPTLFAARLLGIPVIIYDADATPGRVSLWSSNFAHWIGVAHPDAAESFPTKVRNRIARVGHPIRIEIEHPTEEGGYEFLKLDPTRKTILVLGGSLGAQAINNVVLDALPELLKTYNVIHQTGKANYDEVRGVSKLLPGADETDSHYRIFGLLNTYALRMAAGISSVVLCRAGSGTIFEVASWGKPSILVPIPEDISHDQTRNAFSYARSGAAQVIEQANLTPHILLAEIAQLMDNPTRLAQMSESARAFAQPDAARKLAKVLVDTGLNHLE